MNPLSSVLLSCLVVVAPAARAQFTFATNGGALTVTGYSGPVDNIQIPAYTNGLPVTSVAGYTFDYLGYSPVTVTFPATLTSIGDLAFAYDYSLTTLIFEGNAPGISPNVFFDDGSAIAYYLSGTTGWGASVGAGVPTRLLAGINLTAGPTNGIGPLLVTCTAPSSDTSNNAITNWNWSFGDGATSTDQNPTHKYGSIGTFNLTVFETNSAGAPVAGGVMYVTVAQLTVGSTATPTSGVGPLAVSFTSAGADATGHSITAWTWDFGDGSGSTNQNPAHTYTNAGAYLPTLWATNNMGTSALGSGPAAISVFAPPQSYLTLTVNNGAVAITGYLGGGPMVEIPSAINGLPVTSIANYAFQNNYNLNAVYFEGNAPTAGPYTFLGDTLTAYYLAGSTGWGSTIGAGMPTRELTAITISATPTNGLAPLAVNFTAEAIDGSGNPVTNWNWDFGDGSRGTGQNPSHTYTAGGAFSIALVEYNSAGTPVAGALKNVSVTPLTTSFSVSPTNGLQPLGVTFSGPAADSGGHSITSWTWDFGDGSVGAGQNPSHTYTNNGIFRATLVATNNVGLAVAGSGPAVAVTPLTVAYNSSPSNGLAPLTVSFTAETADNGGHPVSGWTWDFGDGTGSTAQNPSHTYTNTGVYYPALLATNSLGLTVPGSGPATVSALLPLPQYNNFTVVHTFVGTDGAHPYAGLSQYGNRVHGTTQRSVSPPNGTVYTLNVATLAFNDLIHFPVLNPPGVENYDGAYPAARVIHWQNTVYGTASLGGRNGYGTLFSVDSTSGTLVSLHPFTAATYDSTTQLFHNGDGVYPASAVVLAGGVLYGTTADGGAYGYGVVYSFNTANSNFTTLHAFTGGNDGAFAVGDLIISGDTLYGTTSKGGTNGYGTVFSLGTGGAGFASLYSFTGGADGAYPPPGALLLLTNTLYGAASQGGSNGMGTVFSLNTDGSGFRSLYSFTGGADGSSPGASLIASSGTLYGVASSGGAGGSGTLFSLEVGTSNSTFATLYGFSSTNASGINNDGANPQAGLALNQGVLYGAARNGGTNGDGTVFAFPLSALAPGVDLTYYSDNLSTISPHAGDTVLASVTITNQACAFGGTNAGAFHVGFYGLASSSAGLNTLKPFWEQAVSGCGASSTVSFNLYITITASTAPGTWYMGYKINDENEVAECDPYNNGIRFWTLNLLPTLPPKVTGPIPTNGATAQPITTSLSWSNDPGATSYDIYFNGQFMSNQAVTTFSPAPLGYASTYGWRVDAKNSGGTTTGDSWNFTTISPTLGASRQGPNFVLSWPTNAAGFTLEYATNMPPSGWATANVSTVILNGQFTVTNTSPGPSIFYRLLK